MNLFQRNDDLDRIQKLMVEILDSKSKRCNHENILGPGKQDEMIFRKNGIREKYRHVSNTINFSSDRTIVRYVTRLAWFPLQERVVRLSICSNNLESDVYYESHLSAASYHLSFTIPPFTRLNCWCPPLN